MVRSILLHLLGQRRPKGQNRGFNISHDIDNFSIIFWWTFLKHVDKPEDIYEDEYSNYHLSWRSARHYWWFWPAESKKLSFSESQEIEILKLLGHFHGLWASFLLSSARSCAKATIETWCEALSSISSIRGAQRAKIQVSTFRVTLTTFRETWIFALRGPLIKG